MPPGTAVLGTDPVVLNFANQPTHTGFNDPRVPKKFQEVLQTIHATRVDIVKAKERRVATAKARPRDDFSEWDRSIREAESALRALERLAEPVNLDVQHRKGQLRVKTRLSWEFHGSKNVSATTGHLTLALNRMLSITLMPQMQPGSAQSLDGRLNEELPPPYISHQEDTKKAIAERRRDDQERMANLLYPNSTGQYSPPTNDTGAFYRLGENSQSGFSFGSATSSIPGVPSATSQSPHIQPANTPPERGTTSPISPTTSNPRHLHNRIARVQSQHAPPPGPSASIRTNSSPSVPPLAVRTNPIPRNTGVASPLSAPPTLTQFTTTRSYTPPANINELDGTSHSPAARIDRDELFIPANPSAPSRSFLGRAISSATPTLEQPTHTRMRPPPPPPPPFPPQAHNPDREPTAPRPKRLSLPSRVPGAPMPPYPVSRQATLRTPNEQVDSDVSRPRAPAQSDAAPRLRRKAPTLPPVASSNPHDSVMNTQRSFAGHRSPVEVRWRPYQEDGQDAPRAQQPLLSLDDEPPMPTGHWAGSESERVSYGVARKQRPVLPYPTGEYTPYSPDDVR